MAKQRLAQAALLIGVLAGCSAGPELETRASDPSGASFDGRALLVLSDADMAGTAYADGDLKPAGQADALAILRSPIGAGDEARIAASNSVMGWPGALDASRDGRFAYVVETRGPAPAGATTFKGGVNAGMPKGRLLTAIDLAEFAAPRIVGTLDVGEEPTSVHVAPSGRFALISRKEDPSPVAAVMLDDGAPTRVLPIPFVLGVKPARPDDRGASFVRLAPNGVDFVLNIANTHLQFARLVFGPDGAPAGAQPNGPPIPVGKWISTLRWSPDGRHLLVADVAWSPSQLGAVLNGAGQVLSVAFDADGEHRVVSSLQVSLSPEGMDINRTGDLVAVVNMERTYLPESMPYRLFGRRERSSLSLVGFDEATGRLSAVDGPVAFEGVLPEDVVFDADGDMIAVAVFHGKEEAPQAGWVAYFRVDRSGAAPRLVPTGQRMPTTRGAHDLILIP
jgi:hypothetical protein